MERVIIIPKNADEAAGGRAPRLRDRLLKARGEFGLDIVDRLKKHFGASRVTWRLALSALPDTSDASSTESDYNFAVDLAPTSSQHADIEVVAYPAAGMLMVSGPQRIAAMLQRRKHHRDERVVRIRSHRIVSAVVDAADDDARNPDFWHLDGEHGIHVPANRAGHGDGVAIGFVDTGIFAGHREFAGRKIFFARISRDGTRVMPSATPRDTHGHGTHMIALAAGNHLGVAPHADLAIASCPLSLERDTQQDVAQQILAGAEYLLSIPRPNGTVGVDVLNLSLGVEGYSDAFADVLYAIRRRKGLLVIAAIGNRGEMTHDSPGDYLGIHGIGATTKAGTLWGDTSRAKFWRGRRRSVPRFVAPGARVWSAGLASPAAYRSLSGTSIASAICSGVAAAAISEKRRSRPAFPASSWMFRTKLMQDGPNRYLKVLY